MFVLLVSGKEKKLPLPSTPPPGDSQGSWTPPPHTHTQMTTAKPGPSQALQSDSLRVEF